ncbi:sensor histidine kinase [Nitriliruptor alkaliphilus]|uniref:sensor histidine kinase n=1 Tax=Nitriliruptor alkaliphilus TaxID=427918 RepID=UPI0006960E70|nr:ATP-binding protein [Nitriliruptor alkaliphilus]
MNPAEEGAPPTATRRALTARAIRVASLAPVLVIAASGVAHGVEHAVVLTVALVVIVLLVGGGLRTERFRRTEAARPPVVPAVIGAIGVAAGVVALTAGTTADSQDLAIIFGVVIVAAAFALPQRHRRPVVAWSILGWAVTLVVDGVRDPVMLVTQIGGAFLLAVVALLSTGALESALRIERQASRESRTRASLLASVLRLQALQPTAVFQAVVQGARDAGLDSAILRVVDGQDLRLVAARPLPGVDPPIRLGPDDGLASVVRRTGRTSVVADYPDHPASLSGSRDLRGAIGVPIVVDGEVSAVLVAGRREQGITELQVEAIELLAEEAGIALGRARRFEADASTVAELRRLDERTHDFVSTVSHELRTPMTVIHGLGQTLERRWDDLAPGRRADLLRRIDQNAERLAVMVRSLVDTSALERGELVARTSTVALATCVSAVLGRLSSLFEDHPVHVEVDEHLAVEADPSLLEHVVENLLSNAARHTPRGTQVWVRAEPHGSDVQIAITDDGPGIPETDLPHVLERFYRAGEPTTRPSGGLGLGLALSQQILQAHGQELTVRSGPAGGTSFEFRLRAAPHGSAADPVRGVGRW